MPVLDIKIYQLSCIDPLLLTLMQFDNHS